MNGEKLETMSTQSIAQLQDVFGRPSPDRDPLRRTNILPEPTMSHASFAREASSLRLAPFLPLLFLEVELLPSGYVPCFRIQVRRRLGCMG